MIFKIDSLFYVIYEAIGGTTKVVCFIIVIGGRMCHMIRSQVLVGLSSNLYFYLFSRIYYYNTAKPLNYRNGPKFLDR